MIRDAALTASEPDRSFSRAARAVLAVAAMKTLGFSLLSLVIATAAACGGGSSSSAPQPTSSEAGPDTGGGPDAGSGTPEVDASHPDGGSEEASTSTKPANGTVRGHTFTFAHGIATPKTVGGAPGYEILLSDKPIDCATAILQSATTVDVGVAGQPPAAKTYAVVNVNAVSPGPSEAYADFNVEDATCGSVVSDSSFSGTLALTSFDATNVKGSLDATFQTSAGVKEGSVAGTFEAVVCVKFPALTCTPH